MHTLRSRRSRRAIALAVITAAAVLSAPAIVDAAGLASVPATAVVAARAPTATTTTPPSTTQGKVVRYAGGANRTNPAALHGTTVSGLVYVDLLPQGTVTASGITKVAWHRDGTYQREEAAAPYDYVVSYLSAASPFDTRTLTNGVHTIKAVVTRTGGSTFQTWATFTVANGTTTTTTAPTTVPTTTAVTTTVPTTTVVTTTVPTTTAPTTTMPPATTPPPTTTTTAPATRNAYLQPFASDSVWNSAVGSAARFADPRLDGSGLDGMWSDTTTITRDPSAPLLPVTSHSWSRTDWCTQAGDPMLGLSLPFPADLVIQKTSGTPNSPASLLESDGRHAREVNYLQRCAGQSTLSVASGTEAVRGSFDLLGDGLPVANRLFGAHGGSLLPAAGGVIRLGEVSGSDPIRHALKITMDLRRWGLRDLSAGRNAYVWPAVQADGGSSVVYGSARPAGNTGVGIPMGGLLAIPPGVDIEALGLETAVGRTLAWTLQNYGVYVVENGSDAAIDFGEWSWHWERGVADEVAASLGYAPWVGEDTVNGMSNGWYRDNLRLMDALQLVTSNGPSSKGGGGTPRQAASPPAVLP